MRNYNKAMEIEANKMADEVILKMRYMQNKDIEKMILNLPSRVAKLVLIKMIRKSK